MAEKRMKIPPRITVYFWIEDGEEYWSNDEGDWEDVCRKDYPRWQAVYTFSHGDVDLEVEYD